MSSSRAALPPGAPGTAGSPRRHRQGKPAGAIYGQIVAASTLAVLGHDASLGPVAVLLSLLATMVVLWVAHVYSELVAERVHHARQLSGREVADAMAADWPLVQASAPAALGLVPAALGLWSRDAGITVALVLGVLSLLTWGLVIGRRSRLSWPRTVAVAGISGALGVVIVVLELLIH